MIHKMLYSTMVDAEKQPQKMPQIQMNTGIIPKEKPDTESGGEIMSKS